MKSSFENRVNDEDLKKMTEAWIKWHGGDYHRCFIERKLLYGFRNDKLDLENMLIVNKWIEEIDNCKNYVEAYYKFVVALEEKYGNIFLKEHSIKKEKATPIKTKMMYNQGIRYQDKNDEYPLISEKIIEYCLTKIFLIGETIYLSKFGFIPFILGISTQLLLNIEFAIKELGIPIFIEVEESKNIVDSEIKKIIYAYKIGEIDIYFLKLWLYNLVNILNKNYNKKEDCINVKIKIN